MQSTVGININLDTFLFFPNAEAICQHVNSAMGVVAANVAIDGPDLLPDITKTTAAAAAATPGEEGVTPGPQLHNTDPRTVFERTPEGIQRLSRHVPEGCCRTQSGRILGQALPTSSRSGPRPCRRHICQAGTATRRLSRPETRWK